MNGLIPTVKSGNEKSNSLGFRTLPTFSSWLDDIFESRLTPDLTSNFNRGMTLPAVNVIDSTDDYVVEMAIPGMSKSDFDISLDNQILTISAEEKTTSEENEEHYTRREFGYASFKRSFSLPDSVESEKIKAKYEDGILKVHLPKKEEAKKKPIRNIKIS
ncbi:MAG: Hsp20/alpha crystallin family protein [Bacteroidia bacterium]|nr:Hsp20/alpha crystallin family protein [Bacteroidia bacterium]NND25795.1 Hsp20/alpha crystallin family protein [Flavobacteriaceae bacterium]MBT8278443.1 Hsp20/alpha crystallin family protein [Bacteroidia bacterium]NNK60320.1 Hsp20/alpha crystallin family protein [Flavobacteriaceae bacterium]NNL33503.1 Hsp20/alpha crystallin family protein [Flavobacteriaceae bacterium]